MVTATHPKTLRAPAPPRDQRARVELPRTCIGQSNEQILGSLSL